MRIPSTWTVPTLLAAAAGVLSCTSDDPGIVGVGSPFGRSDVALRVTPADVVIPILGGREQLSVSIEGAHGEGASQLSVGWTSLNPSVVTVDASGQVTGVQEGTARVEARVLNLADTATVRVTRLPARVEVSPDGFLFAELGVTRTASAQVFDGSGEPLDSAVSWASSNGAVATVDERGVITARGEGFARIVATSRAARDELEVEVDTGAAALQLSTDSIAFDALQQSTWLTVTAVDALGAPTPTPPLVYVVDDTAVARVSGDTLLVAQGAGVTALTIRAAGASLQRRIPVVVDPKAASVRLSLGLDGGATVDADEATVETFTTWTASVEVFDANGFRFVPAEPVEWTNTDPEVLTLDTLDITRALLQFTDPGTTTVIAVVGDVADLLAFTVVEPAELALALDADTVRMVPGGTETVTPIFSTPDSVFLCCGRATWTSSDPAVVTVLESDPDGLEVEAAVTLQGEGVGTAWVRAARGVVADSVFVEVSESPPGPGASPPDP